MGRLYIRKKDGGRGLELAKKESHGHCSDDLIELTSSLKTSQGLKGFYLLLIL